FAYAVVRQRRRCLAVFPYTTLFRAPETRGFCGSGRGNAGRAELRGDRGRREPGRAEELAQGAVRRVDPGARARGVRLDVRLGVRDRKSTRLNSSHVEISYAVFCLKK